jgi:tetratricopeptide (TPR) repeat protein
VLPLVDRAIEEYRVAADLYPRWYDPQWNLGIAFNLRGRITGRDEDWQAAIESLRAAIERADRPSRARYWLATTYGAWGKYEVAIPMLEALADADRSEDTGKRNKLYLLPLAQFHRDEGDMEGAERIYREIVDVAPNEPTGYIGIARCQVDTDRRKEAVATIRELCTRRKDDPNAWIAVADFFLVLDPPERAEAAKAWQRALALGHPVRAAERERYLGE